ncbi:hypothetical protein U1Q18_013372 [Sarracenia purpurea var. burkii]
MSCSSHSKNLTGLEIVPYVPNPKRKIDDALALEREQSPLVISLLKYFHHKKSERTFRSFIEVEAFIIDASFPKEKKHKETAIEPWKTGSSEQASFGRKRTPSSNDRQMVEEFLKEAWNNLINSSTQIEDAGSSTIDREAHKKQTHDEAGDKILNSFRPRKHRRKTTSSDDFDEDRLQEIMEELKMILDLKN